MKKKTMIITFAAALSALTSCGKEVSSLSNMAASPKDNTGAVAISAGTDKTEKTNSSSNKYKDSSYEDIALDLVEKYYEMKPQFLYRFISYSNPDDTVTFKLTAPYTNGDTQDVVFARISGKGFEFNSIDDIMEYKKTVYSENFANKYPMSECTEISSDYSSGDYIDETGVDISDMLYYKSYIMYNGKMYTNTVSPQVGWIGHTAPTEPIIITDVTDTSFRAYYPNILGSNESKVSSCCDIVDFIIEPSCGEWRINSLESTDYSVYEEKAGRTPEPTTVREAYTADTAYYPEGNSSQYDNSSNAKTAFDMGRIEGSTYISDYAGLKLKFPENAEFLDDSNLYTSYMMPTRFMSEEERAHYKTGVIDASVTYGEAYNKVNVWFYNTKLRYPENPDISAEEFLQLEEMDYTSDFEVTDICGPERISLGGNEYVKISYTVSSYPHIAYARRIDDENIILIQTSETPANDFESRFEAIR
ncbi:MAG: hypothetical protein K5898_11860 [Ruminococcus sp.]|uniref:hypothetical protein n=1 Tax=Ruminococcus sp. TaxID=41978 RepID=UPI0025E9C121|nr:hypothetical protein [Ruminococcus sp.]MCR4795834.1 hypothetical protein [Ruminococcus sp.]